MNLTHFKAYSKGDILSLTSVRQFETKIGERVHTLAPDKNIAESLASLACKYVVIGVPEDIGVQANDGIAGTSSCWLPFLQAFLNIQNNDFIEGDDIAVAGYFDFGDIQFLIDRNAYNKAEKLDAYRHAVNAIDEEVEGLIKAVLANGKIPIVIGGGQNNAYPLIKGAAKGLMDAQKIPLAQINCINLDAQCDYRPTEGRHSGNAFRYAEDDGFLQKFCVLGVHENSLPQNVWVDMVNNPFVDCITYEDVFIYGNRTFRQAIAHAIEFTEDTYTGIELDLKAVEHILCTASMPVGVSIKDAREFIHVAASDARVAYLHICEGAVQMADGQTDAFVGKLISTLTADFIKAHKDAAAI